MKKIPLTKGQFALVDDWWSEYLMQWKWCATRNRNTKSFYAMRMEYHPRKNHISMHRVVAQTPEGMFCDHIHHNTLDNRESELRNVTPVQSAMNRVGTKNKKEGKGIYKRNNGSYATQLVHKGKVVLNKTFKNKDDAIQARKDAEKKYHGEFAYQDDTS